MTAQPEAALPLTDVEYRVSVWPANSDADAPASTKEGVTVQRGVDEPPAEMDLDERDVSPIPDHLNFFLPPKTATVKVEVDTPEPEIEQSTVRLIGFVTSDSEDEHATLALLRVGGKLIPIQAGEEFDGISLLSADMKNRSVEIRHLDECMTLAMMDQPIENPAVQGLAVQPVRRRAAHPKPTTRHSAAPDEFQISDPGFATPPEPDLGLGAIPDGMDLELPEELRLPEMPELPELEGLPGLP
ncbi:hypothetical protein NZK35_02095 [Stieleria sp. ICT_E10.1]|uniref:hypothetical protein n=1 Tax=Stieleria sedimenti TaxID=2976331 RepID=UPI00217FB2B0|nr:hypothetical protein [Stieleria sedimenti]MCS7465458.1 hypothetical protein [Stieleria sedimenti]